jgi:hypothetical protein
MPFSLSEKDCVAVTSATMDSAVGLDQPDAVVVRYASSA